jgi:hypothetical protein
MATLAYEGGEVAPTASRLQTPSLVVYSDGTVIALAEQRLQLPTAEVANLIGALRTDLAGFAESVAKPRNEDITDVGTTIVTVRLADGSRQTVSAYALGYLDGYPGRLKHAWGELDTLLERVIDEGEPFRSDRVRIAAWRTDTTAARPWPTGVTVPTTFGVDSVAALDLTEAETAAFEAARVGRNAQEFTLPDGQSVLVHWRYLLPHE